MTGSFKGVIPWLLIKCVLSVTDTSTLRLCTVRCTEQDTQQSRRTAIKKTSNVIQDAVARLFIAALRDPMITFTFRKAWTFYQFTPYFQTVPLQSYTTYVLVIAPPSILCHFILRPSLQCILGRSGAGGEGAGTYTILWSEECKYTSR